MKETHTRTKTITAFIVPIGDKRCSSCGETKPLSEFSVCSGRRHVHCKECRNAYGRKDREDNPLRYKQTREKWNSANKERMEAVRKKYVEKYPERIYAKNCVNNSIIGGRMERGVECEKCGSDKNLHAHHEDYSKPLEVNWLCNSCHQQRHFRLRKGT